MGEVVQRVTELAQDGKYVVTSTVNSALERVSEAWAMKPDGANAREDRTTIQ